MKIINERSFSFYIIYVYPIPALKAKWSGENDYFALNGRSKQLEEWEYDFRDIELHIKVSCEKSN